MMEAVEKYVTKWQLGAAVDLLTTGQSLNIQLGWLRQLTETIRPALGDSSQKGFQSIAEILAKAHCHFDPDTLLAETTNIRTLIDGRSGDYAWANSIRSQAVLKLVTNRVQELSADYDPASNTSPSSGELMQIFRDHGLEELHLAYTQTLGIQPKLNRSQAHAESIAKKLRLTVELAHTHIATVCHHLIYMLALIRTQDSPSSDLIAETLAHLRLDMQSLAGVLASIETDGVILSDTLTLEREQANAFCLAVDQMIQSARRIAGESH